MFRVAFESKHVWCVRHLKHHSNLSPTNARSISVKYECSGMFRASPQDAPSSIIEVLGIQFVCRKDFVDEPLTLEELQEWAEEEKLPPRFRAGPLSYGVRVEMVQLLLVVV